MPRPPEELDAALGLERHQRAEQAYHAAQQLLAEGQPDRAIAQLDMATDLDPGWSAPVALRATTFGALALRYEPSEMLLSAQAADLQRLLALEPNVEVVQRSQQLIALRKRSEVAQQQGGAAAQDGQAGADRRVAEPGVDHRRDVPRRGGLSVDGARRAAPAQHGVRGVSMLSVGVAMAPAAISLGVLAGKQARRDQATRELNAYHGDVPSRSSGCRRGSTRAAAGWG
jgi:hypothetical protein